MQITVNGNPTSVEPNTSVGELLQQLALEPVRVAVEINEDLVPRKRFAETLIRGGDRIEVVTFVGGG